MMKTLTVLATVGALAAGAIAMPSKAEARWRHGGGGVAAGVVGGLAAGAIIGSAVSRPYGYGYGYGGGPYAAYGAGYGPGCYWQRERVWGPYGWRWHRVRVCG
jgi:hypothetical protein